MSKSLLGARAAKAYGGAVVAALGTLGTALADERVTSAEWVGVAGALVAGFLTVYFVPNAAEPDPETSTPDPIRGDLTGR